MSASLVGSEMCIRDSLAQLSYALQQGTLEMHARGGAAVRISSDSLWPAPEEKQRHPGERSLGEEAGS
eukprot:4475531-Alexandrium_andersonii.AAC.1